MSPEEIKKHIIIYILLALHLVITLTLLFGPVFANKKSLPWILLLWPVIASSWIVDKNKECILTKVEYRLRNLDPSIEPGFISRIITMITGYVPTEDEVTKTVTYVALASWLIGYNRLTKVFWK